MKKLMSVLVAGVMLFSLAACANKDDADKETSLNTTEEATTVAETSASDEKQETEASGPENTSSDATTEDTSSESPENTQAHKGRIFLSNGNHERCGGKNREDRGCGPV